MELSDRLETAQLWSAKYMCTVDNEDNSDCLPLKGTEHVLELSVGSYQLSHMPVDGFELSSSPFGP